MGDLIIKDLTVEYPSAGFMIRPIDRLSAKVPSGSLALLLGPSGCGKTTLLSCLAGLQSPSSGAISFDGEDIANLSRDALAEHRRGRVGIVFQAFNLIASLTALENVEVPLLSGGKGRAESRARAVELLERVSLGDRLRHRPGMLSGGQQQRVAIARALAWDPPLVLADEPTAHLDYVQVEEVLLLLRELAQPGRVVVVATHDERLLPLADVVIDLAPRPAEADTRSRRGRPTTVSLDPGEVLFTEGSPGDRIYRVESGEVELVRVRAEDGEQPGAGREQVLELATAGDVFGEMAPLFGLQRSATARARTAAKLTGYTVPQFRALPGGSDLLETLAGKRSAPAAAPATQAAPVAEKEQSPTATKKQAPATKKAAPAKEKAVPAKKAATRTTAKKTAARKKAAAKKATAKKATATKAKAAAKKG